jgi:hypothetical protein
MLESYSPEMLMREVKKLAVAQQLKKHGGGRKRDPHDVLEFNVAIYFAVRGRVLEGKSPNRELRKQQELWEQRHEAIMRLIKEFNPYCCVAS